MNFTEKITSDKDVCLHARLVETGVRFVEVQLGGWDMHNGVFDGMATRGATLDQGLSALLSDLERTGKIDDTMVVVASEFGRTPEVKAGRIGRDHHPTAFSAMLAGGGIKVEPFMVKVTNEHTM